MHSHSSLELMLSHLLLSGVSVLLVAAFLPGIKVKSYGAALGMAIVAGVFNAIAWQFFAPLTVTFAVLTLGLGALIVNGLVFLFAGKLVPGVEISGCTTAAIASLGVTFLNWVMHFFVGGWAP